MDYRYHACLQDAYPGATHAWQRGCTYIVRWPVHTAVPQPVKLVLATLDVPTDSAFFTG